MIYDFKVVPPPTVHSSQPFLEQHVLIDNILKTKSVFIDVSSKTKTSLYVGVYNGPANFACSYIPDGCEHLKFYSQDRTNMWYGHSYTGYYFKILKSQKWSEFKFYLTKLLDSLHLNSDDVLTVNVELPWDIQQRLEAPAYN